jgi:hypothetical protein
MVVVTLVLLCALPRLDLQKDVRVPSDPGLAKDAE